MQIQKKNQNQKFFPTVNFKIRTAIDWLEKKKLWYKFTWYYVYF
jgi:hypothetical protein